MHNITAAKNNLTKIGKSLKSGDGAFFLRNGQPVFVAITPSDFEQWQQYKSEQQQRIWELSLPSRPATTEEEVAFAEAEQERAKFGRKIMTVEEIMSSV